MKIYLIGGAVRDTILGIQPHDFDYVVTGSDITEMSEHGFLQVGKDFPVFLHPQTRCEYALARKEIKTGPRHTDFQFIFDRSVTLEEDLERRDFTCNALAQDCDTKEIIDYHRGLDDINNKVLRHVNSNHFPEDPLRVLRMCRFAAQLNFSVAPETLELATNMVKQGMLKHLTPERVWGEVQKAMTCPGFFRFLETARQCGALEEILPEVNRLWTVPECLDHHPEGNSGAHTLLCLKAAADCPAPIKFAVMLHDIGKIATPQAELPHHHNHENAGTEIIGTVCRRLKAPAAYCNFAKIVCAEHMKFHRIGEMRLASLIRLIDRICKNHRPENLNAYIEACHADMSGRGRSVSAEKEKAFAANAALLRTIQSILQSIRAEDMPDFENIPKGTAFRERYENYRFHQVKKQLSVLYGIKTN